MNVRTKTAIINLLVIGSVIVALTSGFRLI
ncbi:hypothetical protein JOC95_000266 [Bacillus tianshenii]|uniref:Uncharacterized protein n=1 Tax=Sutcliffiella tianshenii TaxID=1463404 RepID=A0ABS2NUU8_9BACI|nr:hypothetical protein [Bacillus tianshenii]